MVVTLILAAVYVLTGSVLSNGPLFNMTDHDHDSLNQTGMLILILKKRLWWLAHYTLHCKVHV